MRAVLLGLLLLTACDKKKEESPPTPPAPSPTPAAPTPATPTPPSPTPAPPPAPVAPAPNIDCAAVVTTDDVTGACGNGFEVKADENPINKKYAACALVLTATGKQDRIATISVNAKHDAAEAENWVKLDYEKGTKLTGLGDRAWTQVTDHDFDLGVQKGALVFRINGMGKPPCKIDQLVEVAKKATGRLP